TWAVRFPQELYAFGPERLHEVARAVDPALGGAPLDDENVRSRIPEIIAAVQEGDAAVTNALAPLLTPRHPSQLYEAGLEGLLVLRRPQPPGAVVALFAVVYAAARVVAELFRQPDAHIAHLEYAHLLVTRGQWLSAALALFGVVLLAIVTRTKRTPLGGWRRR